MSIVDYKIYNISVVVLEGRLDIMRYEDLEAKLQELIDVQGEKILLFDCEHLTFLSSAGLRLFIITYKKLHSMGGKAAISGLSEATRKIFDLTGYTKLFPLFPDKEAALEALK